MKTKAEFDAWVEGWMIEVKQRTGFYKAAGMNDEDAEERAIAEVRRKIRRTLYNEE